MAGSAMPGGAMDGAAQDGNGDAMSGGAEGAMSRGTKGGADGGTKGAAARCAAEPTNTASHDEMDRTTTYLLKIRLPGNPEKARKNVGCFWYEEEVKAATTNLNDLIELVVNRYPPRYLEVPHVQYYDGVSKTFPEIRTGQELMLMFEKQKKTKVVDMFIAYIDPSDPYQPISEWHFEPKVITQPDEDNYLQNPLPENEHVGVEEEVIYLTNKPVADVNVVVMYEKGKDRECGTDEVEVEIEDEHEVEFEDEDEDETYIEEEEEDKVQEPDHLPQEVYDVEDPPMTVGTTYPSMKEFKLAISQHGIKYEFEYNIEKSAPYRFRGYCSRKVEDNCPWRIHASTMEDKCTVMVKDWLIEDATLNAKILQGKLKEKYKVNIHYKRVYMGKELALKQLYGDWDSSFDNLYRGPPKKKKKRTTKQASQSSIVPVQDEAPASSTMSFPPSKCSEPSTNKKGSKQQTSGSQGSARCRSRSGSNQPEAVSHVSSEQQHAPAAARTKAKAPVKVKGKRKRKDLAKDISKLPMMSLDSPTMGIRSKKQDAASPAMSTRRRRLSL